MNMQKLMQEANKIKRDVEKKQSEIDETVFNASSGLVKIEMNGKREVLKLEIDKSALKEEDDLEMLEDMILIAFNDVLSQIDKKTEEELGMYSSGLGGLF
ncbi:MAG TPA: YbaB/EbfC family nucleoid-associated protein [Mollicutes bacterium]|nr:YbaB/EbfC family nucleoid-associated protein [Mollicutes bacterium]